MADKVSFSVSCTPIEDVGQSQEGSVSTFIAARECFSVSGSGEVASITIESSGGSNDGYASGSPYYHQAIKATEATAGNSDSGATYVLPTLASCKFIVLKHTGFEGAASGSKSSATNTADAVSVIAFGGGYHDTGGDTGDNNLWLWQPIARLAAGEAIVLPLRAGMSTANLRLCASDGTNLDGTIGSNANGVAVEFLAFA